MIGVEARHHFGEVELNEPRFQLNKSKEIPSESVNSASNLASVSHRALKAALNTSAKSFGLDFFGDSNKLLTKLGFRSLAHVKDFRDKAGPHNFMTSQSHLSVQEKVFGLGERFCPRAKNCRRTGYSMLSARSG